MVEVPNARSRQVVNAVTCGPAAPGVAGRAAVLAAIQSRMAVWEMPIGDPRSSSGTISPSSAKEPASGGSGLGKVDGDGAAAAVGAAVLGPAALGIAAAAAAATAAAGLTS